MIYMKKTMPFVLVLFAVFTFSGCGQQTDFNIGIKIPAHTSNDFMYQEDFIYSDEEISPTGKEITISAGKGLGDTEVVLMPVEVEEENAYEPVYLTPGAPVKMDVEKGAWFKIGVAVKNETDEEITVYVNVEDVTVRVE